MDPGIKALIQICVPFLLFMGSMTALWSYRTRAKGLPVTIANEISESSIVIDCTESLMAEFYWKTNWLPRLPWIILPAVYFFVVLNVGFRIGVDFSDLLNPKTNFFQLAITLLILMAVGGLLGMARLNQRIKPMLDAYQLCRGKSQIFKLESTGIWIPTLLMLNPAYWRAAEKKLHEIFIPYDEIELCEIYPKMGNSPSAYKLTVRGPGLEFGKGRIGNIELFQFGIGIKRLPLQKYENRVVPFLQNKLGPRITTRE